MGADGALPRGMKKLLQAARRKAMGYRTTEEVEEYAVVEGEMTPVRRKVTVKEVPPDMTAMKLLLEYGQRQNDGDATTREELESVRRELIEICKGELYGTGKDKL